MLDYRQQRDEFNRSASTDRRCGERRRHERRGGDRRQGERRGASGHDGTAVFVRPERRRADRREVARRESERRSLSRRQGERRRDPSRVPGFPRADGFLTAEEREFLLDMMRLSRDEQT